MNNRQNGRRRGRGGQQARNGQPGSPNNGNRLDSRARGNAAQLLEKYKTLARDAQMQGDRVNTEYYLQFADHYFRVLNETRARFEEQQQRRPRDDYRDGYEGDDNGNQNDDGDDGWDDGDDRAELEPAPAPPPPPQQQRAPRPRRDDRGYQNEGQGQGEVRRERRNGDRDHANGGGNGYAAPEPEYAADSAPARIEIDLPPSISGGEAPVADGEGEAAPKRRRPRRPRAEAAPVEA
jgi:hypothetical protein